MIFLDTNIFNFFQGPAHVYSNTCIKKALPGVKKDWQYPLTNVEKANTTLEILFNYYSCQKAKSKRFPYAVDSNK